MTSLGGVGGHARARVGLQFLLRPDGGWVCGYGSIAINPIESAAMIIVSSYKTVRIYFFFFSLFNCRFSFGLR